MSDGLIILFTKFSHNKTCERLCTVASSRRQPMHILNPKSEIIAATGVSGAGGPTGAQGVAGPTGPTGAAGPTGNLGIKGESADLHFLSLGFRCSIASHLPKQT